jgi:hypothetical protein
MMMQKRIPLRCPSCEQALSVKTMHCRACETTVEGMYNLPLLARLHEEEQQFIIEFVKSSGSLKEMSKHLQLSYPSVRNKLDDIISNIHQLQKQPKDALDQ